MPQTNTSYRVPDGSRVDTNTLHVVKAYLSQTPRLSNAAIAKRTGISRNTVKGISENPHLVPDPKIVDLIKKNSSDMWYVEMAESIKAITPEKRAEMSPYQLTGMAGMAHQNARLAAGETTANVGIAAVVAKATQETRDSGVRDIDGMFEDDE